MTVSGVTCGQVQQQHQVHQQPHELDSAALEEIRDERTLHEVTSCGVAAQAARAAVRVVAVPDRGLCYWPPSLCLFTALTAVDLSGNRLTFVPQSVQALESLEVLRLGRNCLTSIPPEVGRLAALTELDVGRNQLRALPAGLCALSQLKVLNAYGNQLERLPEAFGQLQGLVRLGLKSNRLAELPASFTQLTNLVELFLTDNRLGTLPQGMGALRSLVKLQASHNAFTSLPQDLFQLPQLELFRLAVGALPAWAAGPAGAGSLPKLAWCSVGGNPAAAPVPVVPASLPRVARGELQVGEKLGQGASGEVFKGLWQGREVAIKIFLAEVSPDGSTKDELAINCAVHHRNLTEVAALVVDGGGEGEGEGEAGAGGEGRAVGLVLELVRGRPLAGRPTSEHLLRCKWDEGRRFTAAGALRVCRGVAGALAHLHAQGICHGDLYAHNTMLDEDGEPVLCDFGAAFCYDAPDPAGTFWQAMEVRAFGLLVADVAACTEDPSGGGGARERLEGVARRCLDAARRPLFAALEEELRELELLQREADIGGGVALG